jgi:hypothetical protein
LEGGTFTKLFFSEKITKKKCVTDKGQLISCYTGGYKSSSCTGVQEPRNIMKLTTEVFAVKAFVHKNRKKLINNSFQVTQCSWNEKKF